jgi:uracil-DNA glycosylase
MPDLARLIDEIRACRACEAEFGFTPRPVVMVDRRVRILICGQAPGRRVHESGLPFTDPSGDRLRSWMGVDVETFYGDPRIGVAAMAFCYPGTSRKGGDYPPPPRCAALWRERLMAELSPDLVLLVGSYAQKWSLGARARGGLTETCRAWRDYQPHVPPLPHPSWRNTGWLKKNPWFEAEVTPWLRTRVAGILSA